MLRFNLPYGSEGGATPGLKAFSSDKERRRSKKVSIKAGMAAEPHLFSGHHGASSTPSWSWLSHTMDDLPVSVPAFHGRRRLHGLNVGAVDLKTFFFPPAHTC